jgi:antitoxin YefM
MLEVTVNKFRANLKESVERVISNHEPMLVSRQNGGDFIVVSADDWLQEQETLYVLQSSSLMEQIALSSETHKKSY